MIVETCEPKWNQTMVYQDVTKEDLFQHFILGKLRLFAVLGTKWFYAMTCENYNYHYEVFVALSLWCFLPWIVLADCESIL